MIAFAAVHLVRFWAHSAAFNPSCRVCLLGWSGQKCCGAVMRAFDPKRSPRHLQTASRWSCRTMSMLSYLWQRQ